MGAKSLWRRWRSAIIAAAIILTLLGLLAGALFAQAQYREAAAQSIVQRDRQVALLAAIRLGDELTKLAAELGPVARSQSQYLGVTDKERLYLRGQGQRLSVFDGGVILMDNTGRVRATVPERWDIMSSDWSNQEFFRKLLKPMPSGQYFSSILNVGPENTSVVVVSVPVLGENDEMVGVLAGLFRLGESRVSAFYASIVRLRLPGTGNTYIVDGNNRIIYDSGYQHTGETLELVVARGGEDEGPVKPQLDASGHQVIASSAPIPGTSWVLVTETDWEAAMAPIQRFATGIIVLLALGMVVPAIGAAILARGQQHGAAASNEATLEARVSKEMRARLQPRYTPMLGGWEVAVHHHTAANGATARDFYDFMLLPDGRLMLSLATISDRGLSTIHLMTTARAAFRTAASRAESAGHAMSLCNNLLCPDVGPNAAVTSLFALLDPMSGRLQVANAGFCAPFHWSDGELVEMRERADFLGQALDVEFDHDEVLVGPGDNMIFYSPGALGVRPETGDPFGPARVRQVLNSSGAVGAQAVVDALRMDLSEFADDKSLRRLDVTILALSRSPAVPVGVKPKRSLRDELRALGETETDL